MPGNLFSEQNVRSPRKMYKFAITDVCILSGNAIGVNQMGLWIKNTSRFSDVSQHSNKNHK